MKPAHPTAEALARRRLRELASNACGGILTIGRTARALDTTPRAAALVLAGLSRRGWLRRLRRGLYLILPLEAEARTSGIVEDPWLLAAELFTPCYIGGWTAAEHWGLTEQLFRSTFVATATRIRRSQVLVAGAEFHLAQTSPRRLDGVGTTWRGPERVPLSSPERTIADALIDPSWLGGVRHLADALGTYRESHSRRSDTLIAELEAIGTGAAFKRLGYLVETLELDAPAVVDAALARRTAGIVKLDPAIPARGRLRKRWGLWVNASVTGRARG